MDAEKVAKYAQELKNVPGDWKSFRAFDWVARDPVTGAMNLESAKLIDTPEVKAAHAQAQRMAQDMIAKLPKVENFDFQCLANTVTPGTQWTLELLYAGHVGPDEYTFTVDYELGSATPNFVPFYSYRCTDGNSGPSKDLTKYRNAWPKPLGLFAEEVLMFLKDAIVRPFPPHLPGLPECFVLPIEVAPFQRELAKFLDTLPKPFTWRIESSSEAEKRCQAFFAERQDKLSKVLKTMIDFKERGNEAYREGHREEAIELYTKAIQVNGDEECYMGAFARQEPLRKQLMAICFANRAAAYLMPGRGLNPRKAIADAELAEQEDPTFKKAYLRQARGHEILGNTEAAIRARARGMQAPAVFGVQPE